MTTAKIFAYKGNVGVTVDPEGKFINDPFAEGQLGAVISTSEVEISKEAKDIIYAADREGGSFAELMLTEHEGPGLKYGKSSIAVPGIGYIHLGNDFKIGRTCVKNVVEDATEVPNDVPQDYKDFIDSEEE
jgi:hypothetical protein